MNQPEYPLNYSCEVFVLNVLSVESVKWMGTGSVWEEIDGV